MGCSKRDNGQIASVGQEHWPGQHAVCSPSEEQRVHGSGVAAALVWEMAGELPLGFPRPSLTSTMVRCPWVSALTEVWQAGG